MPIKHTITADYGLLHQNHYLPPPPKNTRKPQKKGEMVSSEKRDRASNVHLNSTLCAFVT